MSNPPDTVYYTVKQNWNGYLWPRTWPNENAAWRQLTKETGMTKKQIEEKCDWSIVPVRLVEQPK